MTGQPNKHPNLRTTLNLLTCVDSHKLTHADFVERVTHKVQYLTLQLIAFWNIANNGTPRLDLTRNRFGKKTESETTTLTSTGLVSASSQDFSGFLRISQVIQLIHFRYLFNPFHYLSPMFLESCSQWDSAQGSLWGLWESTYRAPGGHLFSEGYLFGDCFFLVWIPGSLLCSAPPLFCFCDFLLFASLLFCFDFLLFCFSAFPLFASLLLQFWFSRLPCFSTFLLFCFFAFLLLFLFLFFFAFSSFLACLLFRFFASLVYGCLYTQFSSKKNYK